jgi:hypothetical protein
VSPLAFLAPAALAALGLAAIPLVVHMLRRARSRRLDFPSLEFLRETPSLARRLAAPNRIVLLLLRIVTVALVALAFARPVWIGATPSSTALVVLLDASASMRRPTAHEQALAAAREAIGSMGPRDRVCVGAFAGTVTWLSDFGRSDEALRALDGYEASLAAGAPGPALTAASRLLVDEPASVRRLVVISDFQRSNGPWNTASVDPSIRVESIRAGGGFDNAFVSSVRVEGTGERATAVVASVHASAAGRDAGIADMPLRDGTALSNIELFSMSGGWRAVAVARDEFDADDARYFVAPRAGRIVVCDPDDPYLRAAAEAAFGQDRVDTVSSIDDAALANATLAYVGQRSLGRSDSVAALDRWVRAGGDAVVFAPAATSWPFPSAEGDELPVGGLVRSAPDGRGDSLDRVLARTGASGVRSIGESAVDRVVLRSATGQPVAVRRAIASGNVTVVGFEVSASHLPLVRDPEYVSFVEWLGGRATTEIDVGDRLANLDPDTRVIDDAGQQLARASDGAIVPVRPGVLRLERRGRTDLIAVNVPRAESEPAVLDDDELSALRRDATTTGAPRGALVEIEARQTAWRYLIAAAALIALVELWVALRTARRPVEVEQ